MTLIDWFKAKKTLFILAAQEGCSMAHIRRSIQACIDAAWNNVWTPGNLKAQVRWQRLFPGGKKPTVEEFIIAVSRNLSANESFSHLHK